MTIQLRIQSDLSDATISELPVACTGSLAKCNEYATSRGYTFRTRRGMMFGGYFAHPSTGVCLYLT